jgi:epoxyqueuosine reductase QueG
LKWVGTHQHVFEEVVRKKGNSVRYGCNSCPKIGPWIRFVEANTAPDTKYEAMSLPELRAEAKKAGIVGYSKMRKDDIRERLASLP